MVHHHNGSITFMESYFQLVLSCCYNLKSWLKFFNIFRIGYTALILLNALIFFLSSKLKLNDLVMCDRVMSKNIIDH